MSDKILRHGHPSDTAANWKANNPVVGKGEFAIESDTVKFKIGDGTTKYNSLKYATYDDTNAKECIETMIPSRFGNGVCADISNGYSSNNTADGDFAHAEGTSTTASGYYSHTEGVQTSALVEAAHAEGK